MSIAPVRLIISGTTAIVPKVHCFQRQLPDAFAFAMLPSIYNIWSLYGPDNVVLHDLRVTRECTLP